MRRSRLVALYLSSLVIGAGLFAIAGPLDPPGGPVASTYKTLGEIEPRIAINATNTPGDADSLFRIAQPGSYYLTGNITGVASKHGIEIEADGVTLDLGGFELRGIGGMGPFDGIRIARNALTNIAVVNGSVRNWGDDGVDLDSFFMNNGRVEHITAAGNAGAGIRAGQRFTVAQCSAFQNGNSGFEIASGSAIIQCTATANVGHGISTAPDCTVSECSTESNAVNGLIAGSGNTVTGCSARLNAGRGIEVGPGCTVTGCVASDNTGVGIAAADSCTLADCTSNSNNAAGINAGNACSITNCTSTGNGASGITVSDGCTITGCTVNNNTAAGIFANNGCRITGNMLRNNQQDGIRVNFSCVVADNNCNGDGAAAGTHAGIHAVGQANRLDANNITFADRGVLVDQGGNFIVRNSCRGCAVNYALAAGNADAQVLTPGTAFVATNPWANFSY